MLPQLRLDPDAPWKARFRAPFVGFTQLAKADPTRGLAVTNRSGAHQLYAWHVPTGELRQMTHTPEGKLMGYISPDGHYIYYLKDTGGNEIGHWVRVPFMGGDAQDITPDLPPYASNGLAVSRAGNLLNFTLAARDGFHLYTMNLGSEGSLGRSRRVWSSAKLAQGPLLSYGGEVAVMASTERFTKFQYSLVALDGSSGALIGELWDSHDASIQPVVFSPLPGDVRLAATTNRSGVRRPVIWNPRTGERTDLEFETLSGEIGPLDWSSDGQQLLLRQFDQAVEQLYLYDLATETLTRLDHPAGSFSMYGFGGAYFGPHDEIYAQWQDAAHPARTIALSRQTGALTRTVLSAGEAPPGRPWRSVAFTSSDGANIQGWLATPEGGGPFPTILHTHGGPTAVMTATYAPESQAFLDHGLAVLSINYRGSTTFGREFQDKINGALGHWEVEDMVAAREWLIQQNIAHPNQIFLTGWSYGGYLTLMGLGKRPDLWAGGMAGIAIADWAVQYEDTADTLRGYQVALLGGTPKTAPETYKASSPITYLENVSAPVLVLQGRNDTRCPARPMEIYEARMRERGHDFEIVWFDAGHGALSIDEQISHRERMLRFVYRVLNNHS